MAVTLYSRRNGSGEAVVLLHGLFGSGSNLGALDRHLQGEWDVLSPDLPGHGRSAWLADYSLPAMAQSMSQWLAQQEIESAHFIGHSLGGKVAMQMALAFPTRVRSLILADIAPVLYQARHDAVFAALQAVAVANCTERAQAEQLMHEHLRESDVIAFLLGSLRRDAGGVYRWRLDLEGLKRSYMALSAAVEPDADWPGPVLFIKGADSDYILPQHRAAIARLFPAADLKIMRDCGHWLHVQQPRLFNSIVSRFLTELPAANALQERA